MEWSACSPDMNPIDHVWDTLGRRVAGRQPPPQTFKELKRALLEEWERIPQLVINSLIHSMPQSGSKGTKQMARIGKSSGSHDCSDMSQTNSESQPNPQT
ncbi:transposable element Tcb2 transposase [Trichonephila clavipes]|nr:transposable element Tcb2 transposase [Trichonephila clavipes]